VCDGRARTLSGPGGPSPADQLVALTVRSGPPRIVFPTTVCLLLTCVCVCVRMYIYVCMYARVCLRMCQAVVMCLRMCHVSAQVCACQSVILNVHSESTCTYITVERHSHGGDGQRRREGGDNLR